MTRIICHFLMLVTFFASITQSTVFTEAPRPRCTNLRAAHVLPHSEYRHRARDIKEYMKNQAMLLTSEIDAYIVTTFDEHLNDYVADYDKRLHFLTGFTGDYGVAIITQKNVSLWTDEKYLEQADLDVDCDWRLYDINGYPGISQWISSVLKPGQRIGADPKLVPHFMWAEWAAELQNKSLKLVSVHRNLVDVIWQSQRLPPPHSKVHIQELKFAGEKWISKITSLRSALSNQVCDGIVITSLTEIAYLLNLRGNDLPYVPVFKAYLIVTQGEIVLYTDSTRFSQDVLDHLNYGHYHQNSVRLKPYNGIWDSLRAYTQRDWKCVIIPSMFVHDHGVNEAIYSMIPPHIMLETVSPVIFMRAQKNEAEREGMFQASIRDGAAMCEFLSYFETKFKMGEVWTESRVALQLDRTRYSQNMNHGISMKTVVALGPHGSLSHYYIRNATDQNITNTNTIVIKSGGQYKDGTTLVTRTIHFGRPTKEQKEAYTSVLLGIIRLSNLIFPDTLKSSEIDALARGPVWETHNDYPHITGHGVGSFLAVRESPINIAFSDSDNYPFQEGYFFSSSPGFYSPDNFGVRLGNILEVKDTGKRHPSGYKFLAFHQNTFVPFEPKLIDQNLLSNQDKVWLNTYNTKLRDLVGEELKRNIRFEAFQWLINKTLHYEVDRPKRTSSSENVKPLHQVFIYLLTIVILSHTNLVFNKR